MPPSSQQRALVHKICSVLTALLACDGRGVPAEVRSEAESLLIELYRVSEESSSDINFEMVGRAIWRIGDIMNLLGLTEDVLEMIRRMLE